MAASEPGIIDVTTLLRLRDRDLEWRRAEGEVVILDLATQRYLALNRSGALLWEMLAEGATRDDLVASLADAYGIDRDEAARDVGALLEALGAESLMSESYGAAR